MYKKLIVVLIAIVFVLNTFVFSINAVDNEFISNKIEQVYDSDNGLITGKANAICELDDGSIWIGQYAGLTRYDGNTFDNYFKVGDVDVTSVVSLANYHNILFIGTQTGFVKYSDGEFTEISLEGKTLSINALAIYENIVYVGTSEGLYRVSAEDTSAVKKLNDSVVISVSCNKNGVFYVTSDYICYDVNGNSLLNGISAKCVFADGTNVYVGSINGEFVVNGKIANESSNLEKPINTIKKIDKVIYLGCDEGLYKYDGSTVSKINGIKTSSYIEDILQDYQGNIWLVSDEVGISKIMNNNLTNMFYQYGISDAVVTAVEKYNGYTFIATETGLYIVDEQNKTIINNELTKLLVGIRIRDIIVFNNSLYVATYDTDLYDLVVYDGTNISYISKEELVEAGETNAAKAGQVRVLQTDGANLFVGTNYGVSIINVSGIETVKTPYRPLYLYAYSGKLYACFENGGIGLFSKDFKSYSTLAGTESLTVLKCLMTNNGLLYSYNSKLGIYYDNKSQKVNLNVYGSIVELFEHDGKIYVGSDTGLYIFDLNNVFDQVVEYELIGKSKGLASPLQSNASGYYDAKNDVYYFACTNTVYMYNFKGVATEKVGLKFGIKKVVVDDEIQDNGDILLQSSANRVTFNISYFNYSLDDEYTVYYKLDGTDATYQSGSIKDLKSITYTNLRGGDYRFHLYVEDADGNKSESEININITKEKGLLERTVFIVFIIVGGILLLAIFMFILYRVRTKALEKKNNEYKAVTIESIETIARTIDGKDSYTNGHSTRVGQYSKLIAEELGLKKEEVENIYYIALLHDIGKIAVPNEILNKPGRLTDQEFETMKVHTIQGDIILAPISTIPNVSEGARHHHEKYDGSGYPDHLEGEQIPYIARIICCADCFDAMATKRTYKEPYTNEQIINEFERCKGTHFDPEIAEVVIKLIKTGKITSSYVEYH